MFRRREPLSLPQRARRWLWPERGVRRAGHYWWLRLKRLRTGPHSIATGVAIGAAVCFTPFVGLQWGLALFLTWLFRGSLLAATIGTLVANPWTYPLIWFSLFRIGCFILRREPSFGLERDMSADYLLSHLWDIFFPMTMGALLLAPLAGGLVYGLVRAALTARASREQRSKI